MKTMRCAIVVAMLLGGNAFAQINMPNPMSPGSSMDSAVRVIASNDVMVDRFIKRWLRTHYPKWHADPHELMQFGSERYAVVYIKSAENPGRRVYFRLQSRPGDPDEMDNPFPL
jgi:hypothetical protein